MQIKGSRTAFTLFWAGVVLVIAAVSSALSAQQSVVLAIGVVGLTVLLIRPFLGLVLYTFLIQLGGLINAAAGGAGDYVLVGLVAASLAGSVLEGPARPRTGRWGGNPVALQMAVLFLLWGVLSALFAEYRDTANFALLQLASLVGAFYLCIVLVRTRERVMVLLLALFASTVVSSLIAGMEYLGIADIVGDADPGGRNNGAADLSSTTAGNLFLVGTLCAGLLACRMREWRKFTAATFFIGAWGIVFTISRSALMLLVLGVVWIGTRIRNVRYMPALVLLVIIGGVAALPVVPDKVWERFSELRQPSSDRTLGRRFGYHVIGLDLIAQNPVLGIGPGNFNQHYAEFEYRWVEGRRQETTRALHDTYLGVAVEFGIVGFAFFVAMIGFVWHGLQRTRRRARDPTLAYIAESLQLALGVFLISIAALPALNYKMLWLVLGLGTAIASIEKRDDHSSQAS